MEMVELGRSLLPSPTDFVDCAHSERTLSCSPRELSPSYACVTTPHLSEEKATMRTKRKKAESVLLASQQTAPAGAKGTWAVRRSWDAGE